MMVEKYNNGEAWNVLNKYYQNNLGELVNLINSYKETNKGKRNIAKRLLNKYHLLQDISDLKMDQLE